MFITKLRDDQGAVLRTYTSDWDGYSSYCSASDTLLLMNSDGEVVERHPLATCKGAVSFQDYAASGLVKGCAR